ncbi:FixH family protein [Metabacillus sp. KIGAM252]|uniref:FixH family protein n=1 Tax=Metabacillus flavus TaxID=2823519 RepID=A0ABS5LHE0_9BACI|nr:FixH family protein [Metabacillus flavus]MBS2970167.1 FixH family protein [Metabacillus flavus]
MKWKDWTLLVLLSAVLFLTAACQATGSKASDVPEMVNAKISVPKVIRKNETQKYEVKVTQGKGMVQDASSVEFEIWESGSKEQSEMVKAEHSGNGVYSISKAFKEDGIYYLQTHVTARDLHVMPKVKLIVGHAADNGKDKEEKESGHHH